MTAPVIEKETFAEFDKELYKDRIGIYIQPFVSRFHKVLKSYTFFNLFFILLIAAEVIYFFIHLTFLMQTFVWRSILPYLCDSFLLLYLHMYAQTRKLKS